jgi:beta-N-acetylhexosaminidase
VTLPGDQLDQDLAPFRQLVDGGVALVMLANALYPALDADAPAVFSPRIVQGLLRGQLGFRGVVITDDLAATPELPGDAGGRAVAAVGAGADVVLYGPPAAGPVAYQALVWAAGVGALPRARLEDAYRHVLELKGWLPR